MQQHYTDPASELQSQVSRATGEFLFQVADLSRQAAAASINAAFGRVGPAARASSPASPTGPSPKRSPAQIETLTRRFALFVRDNPGLRIEQINKQLGTSTAALLLPIKKLIADEAVATQGDRRSTRYYPGPHFVRRVLDAKPAATAVAPASDSTAPPAEASRVQVRDEAPPAKKAAAKRASRRAAKESRQGGKKKIDG